VVDARHAAAEMKEPEPTYYMLFLGAIKWVVEQMLTNEERVVRKPGSKAAVK
jgi:hypothetical protein